MRTKLIHLFSAVIVVAGMYSCKKDNYFNDTGLANPNTTFTTYDYLAAHEAHYFDTVIKIIDHLGLKDSVNKAGTFFAPTDFAIHRVMNDNEITSLEDLYKRINSKFLTQYMFGSASLTLDNATVAAKTYENWAGTTVGINKLALTYNAATTSFTYYALQYIKINGVLDGSSGAPANDEADALLRCQTTGIKTASGTNLNVLVNNAVLNLIGDTVPTQKTYTVDVNLTQSDNDYTSVPVQLNLTEIAGFLGVTPAVLSQSVTAVSDTLKWYAQQPDGTFTTGYTAAAPGFWFDKNGGVIGWGENAYLFAELVPATFIVNVGQYPAHAKKGDKYTLKQALAFTKTGGITMTVFITFNVTMV